MSEEREEYKLKMNPLGVAIPLAITLLGIVLYFFTVQSRTRVIGLLLAFMGIASTLGISFPLLQLFKAKLKLQEEEQEVKLDRLEEKVREKAKKQEKEKEDPSSE